MLTCQSQRLSAVLAVLGVLLLVGAIPFALPQSRAATVWSDNFNDGDYNGWTVEMGTWTAAGYRLEHGNDMENIIRHASAVATGTWRFDVYLSQARTGSHWGYIYFMGSDLDPEGRPMNSYYLLLQDCRVTLRKLVSAVGSTLGSYQLATNAPGNMLQALEHIDITRNTAGDLNLWINGTHRLQYHDTAVSASTHFVFEAFYIDVPWIDNVLVSDTVDIQPPTTTTTTTTTTGTSAIPGFSEPAIAAGVLVALGAAIAYRRRRR